MATTSPLDDGGPLPADTEQMQLFYEVFLPGYEVYEYTQTWWLPCGDVRQKQTRNVPVQGTDLSVSGHSELRVHRRVNRLERISDAEVDRINRRM